MWNPYLAGWVQPTGLGNKGVEYPKTLLEIRASGGLSARAPTWGQGFKASTTRLVVRPAKQVGSIKNPRTLVRGVSKSMYLLPSGR